MFSTEEFARKMVSLGELQWQRRQATARGDSPALIANQVAIQTILDELEAGEVLHYARAQLKLDSVVAHQMEAVGTPRFDELIGAVGLALAERDRIVPEPYWQALHVQRRALQVQLRAEEQARRDRDPTVN